MRRGRLITASIAASLAVVVALVFAAGAPAAFHLMKVREVHPGGASDGSYVVLQMYSGGQNFVAGQDIVIYDAGGSAVHTSTFASSVSNGSSQATILVAGEGYGTAFPSGPTPDEEDAGLDLPAAGGAACFIPDGGPIDCVSWGSFSGSLPSSAGTPASAGGVTAGKALHRSIEPGCETLLEPGDDTNDSATDFSERDPNPRSNTSPIVEGPCPPPPDETPPDTIIDSGPPDPSGPDVSFTYHSSEGGSSFECSLSSGGPDGFSACSPFGKAYPGLADGEYTFKVQAEDSSGNVDPTPAAYSWTVDSTAADVTPPQTFIDVAPPNPSSSSTAAFAYRSSEAGSSFECKLDGAAFAACPTAGVAYSGLGNGSHAFQVRARDEAGNIDPTPAGYTWDVVLATPPPPSPQPQPPPEEPPPPLPADPGPGTAFAAAVAPVRGAVALLRMRCRGAAGARCSGALRLIARAGGARGSRSKARRVVVARGRYRIPAGRRRLVRARLTGRGKRLLRRAGRRGLEARLVGKGARNRTVKLKPAPRKSRRAKRRRSRRTAARASAFHLIQVREVHAGAGDDSYVVLQMLAAGENFVGGHRLRVYDSAGTALHTFTFGAGYVAPNGSHGNNTILIGDTGVQAAFGVAPDDHADAALEIPASGGAVCWLSGSPPDCVAWGDFSGHGALPAPGAGTPADPAGIPTGMALRRTIARGCATLLDAPDDSDDSAADFSNAFPAPRPNSAPPSERPCSATGGPGGEAPAGSPAGGGASPGARPLRLAIVRGPGRVGRDRTPTFRFRANRRAAFRCKQDGRRARRCRSPFTPRRLRYGCHVFRVAARDARRGERALAVYRFRVVKRRKPGLRQLRRCLPRRGRRGRRY